MGESKHGWSRRGHKAAGENQRSESSMKQTGIKKKINPTGRDGQILTCKPCGSFRHILDACPDSWGNMEKSTGVKPLNQVVQRKLGETGHS